MKNKQTNDDLILSIDCGTQSIRAILVSLEGDIIDKEQVFYEAYYSPKPGWAEQEAETYWKGLCKATNALHKRNSSNFSKIKGVGVTALRSTMVNVDSGGNTLRPSIIWLDQRKAKNVFKPSFTMDIIFKSIGVDSTLKKMEGKGHCNWIRQNEPETWKKTHKYIQVSGYLNYKLSGEFTDSVASQIGHIPFNYKKQRWAKAKDILEFSKKLYPIEKEKLPKLISPGEKIGNISKEASQLTSIPKGVPIIACGSDKGCETLGMGVTDTSMASLSFGTTATVQTTTNKYVEPIKFFPAYPSVMPKHWNPEIEIFRGFWMVNWFKNEFALKEVQEAEKLGVVAEEILNELLHKSPPGAMGLIIQPYWTPGLGEKNAKGAMIGFGDVHKKEHIYRAVIEGLAYGLLDGMHKLEKRGGFNFKKIAVSGGASQSDEICQITADVFNMKLVRGKTHETSGLGSAIITAYGIGAYKTLKQATENMVSYADIFEPNPENAKLYKQLYEDVYLKIFDKLEPLYKRIREITSYPEH
ncbi:MAG: FGGY-family carbohydrate kinase [Flavobacteriales bacterium]|nr:FGGY-family carbohydrate kinase [Flavobacteriales bacterium]